MEKQSSIYINIHVHHSQKNDGALAIRNVFPDAFDRIKKTNFYCSAGIHPWFINAEFDKNFEYLTELAKANKIVAIGEIGLDNLSKVPFGIQKEAFLKQVELANDLKLPVIIHAVKSFQELLAIKKEIAKAAIWVIHGYRKNLQIAKELIKQDCYLSFGEALLFDTKVQVVFKSCPLEKLFLETDDSNCSIEELYKKASEIKEIALDVLKEKICQNFRRLIKIHDNIE